MNTKIKYLTPDNLYEQLKTFTAGMTVTKDVFEMTVDQCLLQDIEWNHMDQMHRLTVHNTYEKGVRIAAGPNFALSLTQWAKWPMLITVTDVYVEKGLFYQSLSIAGIIFVHSIISMQQVEDDKVFLRDEWFVASHKLFKWLHKPLHKKMKKLNARLQDEDQQIREGRFKLRKQGYRFKTDNPDYYNSNLLGRNTIYPTFDAPAEIALADFTDVASTKAVGGMEFIIQKKQLKEDTYLIWPAACPHEGGPLIQGKLCDDRITCPWHALQFSAASLSFAAPRVSKHGFEYSLEQHKISIVAHQVIDIKSNQLTPEKKIYA